MKLPQAPIKRDFEYAQRPQLRMRRITPCCPGIKSGCQEAYIITKKAQLRELSV